MEHDKGGNERGVFDPLQYVVMVFQSNTDEEQILPYLSPYSVIHLLFMANVIFRVSTTRQGHSHHAGEINLSLLRRTKRRRVSCIRSTENRRRGADETGQNGCTQPKNRR